MNNKTLWITGLKGMAALVIFLHHFALFFYPGFIDPAPGNIKTSLSLESKVALTPLNIFSWGGVSGVCIFFTLSGFLIAYNFYKKKSKYDANYVVKRYLKLMLPILFSTLIIFFIIKSKIFRTDSLINLYDKIGLRNNYKDYNPNIFAVIWESIILLFRTSSFAINPPMWTMKFELFYSIISALLINAIGTSKKRFIIYFMLALITLNSYFLCFTLGIILCDLWLNYNKILDIINRLDLKIVIILVSIFLLSSTYSNQNTGYYYVINNLFPNIDYLVVFHSIGAALLILFILLSKKVVKIFSSKIFVFFGNQSLYIYLFHWVLLNTISMYLVLVLNKYMKYYQSVIISFSLTLVILILFSIYFGKYITNLTNIIISKIKKNNFIEEAKNEKNY